MRIPVGVLAVLVVAMAIAGCEAEQGSGAASTDDPIAAALAARDRPDADRDRDQERRPADITRFFRVAPGQTVFEFYAGSGWYSEILARVVGPDGMLVMHNNPLFQRYFEEDLAARDVTGRFDNISYRQVAPRALMLEPGRYDRILAILSYHDVLYPPESGAPAPDRARLMREFYDGMKPGGVLGIVDHVAPSDVPAREAGEELHRVDPELVRREAEAAGFVFDGASDVLSVAGDDHRTPIFDLDRGERDRFVYRFIKPAPDASETEDE